MLLSKLLGERYKEKPADASMVSHVFLLRGGYIRQVATGIYTLLPPAKRIVTKIEAIIRREMDEIGGQEVLFPVVLPAELWHESGRYASVGSELLRAKDRNGHDILLGMTHEEAAVHLARSEATSYSKFPFMIYQIQTKFRDEPRSRGGLVRVREFTMKDAYSFHTSISDLEEYYDICHFAYDNIFRKCGLTNFISVKSDTGMMGGNIAHEFMLLSDSGEDSLAICPCGYSANLEVFEVIAQHTQRQSGILQKHSTPDIKTIDNLKLFFNLSKDRFVKASVFVAEGSKDPIIVFIRGDYDVNESKLRKVVGADVYPLTEYFDNDICFGFIGPYGLKTFSKVLFDKSLEDENDLICGGNELDVHLSGVDITNECLGAVFPTEFFELAKGVSGDICPHCGGNVSIERGIEIGNIFQLMTKYSESMNYTYVDQNGKPSTPYMGCYGIGVGRLMACIVEENHDDHGPIWPLSIAPWQIHIISVGANKNPTVQNISENIYAKLSEDFECIYDDRDVSAGVKFADADLLGIPIRIIIGRSFISNGEVEITTRDRSFKTTTTPKELQSTLVELFSNLS